MESSKRLLGKSDKEDDTLAALEFVGWIGVSGVKHEVIKVLSGAFLPLF